MNLFETVKSAVTVKQAAKYYGCKVNRGDMISCLFHDNRHPNMKLNGKMPMIDEWSGFADLLANLIEKYVSELDVENLPAPAVSFDNQDSAANKKDSDFNAESVESKIAA